MKDTWRVFYGSDLMFCGSDFSREGDPLPLEYLTNSKLGSGMLISSHLLSVTQ